MRSRALLLPRGRRRPSASPPRCNASGQLMRPGSSCDCKRREGRRGLMAPHGFAFRNQFVASTGGRDATRLRARGRGPGGGKNARPRRGKLRDFRSGRRNELNCRGSLTAASVLSSDDECRVRTDGDRLTALQRLPLADETISRPGPRRALSPRTAAVSRLGGAASGKAGVRRRRASRRSDLAANSCGIQVRGARLNGRGGADASTCEL
jgi:hypothetical protein